jgi:hypothetical protein
MVYYMGELSAFNICITTRNFILKYKEQHCENKSVDFNFFSQKNEELG